MLNILPAQVSPVNMEDAMSDTVSVTTTSADLHRILDRQRAAFMRKGPPGKAQRRADLRRLKAEILKRRPEIDRRAPERVQERCSFSFYITMSLYMQLV